jgi:tetratricopeptide (TPR) repeat protein
LLREGSDPEQKSELAAALQELGQVQVRLGQPRIAASCYAESLELLSRAGGDKTRNDRRLAARAHYLLATAPGFREGREANGRRGASAPRPGQEERGAGRRVGAREGRGDPMRSAPPDANPGQFLREAMAQQRFEQLRQQAKSHLEAAIATLDALLAESPNDADSLFLRARCLIEIGRHGQVAATGAGQDSNAEATDILRRLVAEHPQNDAFRFALCEALVPRNRGRGAPPAMPRGDMTEAVANARALVVQKPQHLEYQAALARALSSQGSRLHDALMQKDPKAGISELEEALAIHRAMNTAGVAIDPRFVMEQVQTLRRMLRVQFDAGDLEAARTNGREIVALLSSAARDGNLLPRGDERLGDLPQLLERIGMQDALRELQDAERRRR